MATCRNIHDMIIVFDDLSETQQNKVTDHTTECPSCANALKSYETLKSALRNIEPTIHIDLEMMIRFAVHLSDPGEPDYDGRSLKTSEISTIERHVAECSACQKSLNRLRQDYQGLNKYVERSDVARIRLAPRHSKSTSTSQVRMFMKSVKQAVEQIILAPLPRLVPATVGVMAVFFVIFWFGPFLRSGNPYFDLVRLEHGEISFQTRGNSKLTLGDALAAFRAGNVEKAVSGLQSFIANSQDAATIPFARLVLGIAYLEDAKTNVLGRFERVNMERVEAAIETLQRAGSSSDNLRIREESYWYLANAYLLKQEPENALVSLDRLLTLKGRRSEDATSLIEGIGALPEG